MKKSALILLSLFFLSATPAFAQTDFDCAAAGVVKIMDESACKAIKRLFNNNTVDGPWYDQNPTQFSKKVLQGDQTAIFGERYTFAQINWIINSIATMLNPGAKISNPAQLFDFMNSIYETVKQLKSGIQPSISDYAKLGPAGLFAGGTIALYSNPPASGVQEIKYTAQKVFDVGTGVQPAYAQGFGYNGLSSGGAVRLLWSASRNMAYLIIVIILIAAGFLIMFRVKINPQTVVSLQTMIPKLIITLILITFSFAIAGLVIDMVYVFIAAFVGFMTLGGVITPGTTGLFGATSTGEIIKWLTDPGFGKYVLLQAPIQVVLMVIAPLITLVILGLMSGGVLAAPNAIIGAILSIIIGIMLIIFFWKIFIMLVKSYVILLMQIMIGPLQIMLDLVPGQSGFGPWIRNLIANASVFVVVPVMLVIQHVISWDPITNNILHIETLGPGGLRGVNLQLPYYDLLGSWGGQGALGEWNFITRFILGFVIFSMTSKIADMIRDLLKIPAFKYGVDVGGTIGGLTGAVVTGSKLVQVGSDAATQLRDLWNAIRIARTLPPPPPPARP